MFKKLIAKYSHNCAHTKEVIAGARITFALRVVAAILGFAVNVVVARLLGSDGAGLYFLAISATMIGAVIARMGIDQATLKYIAAGAAQQDWERVGQIYSLAFKSIALSSAIVTLLIFTLAPFIASYIFNEPRLEDPLRWMSLAIFAFSIMTFHAECLKGIKKIKNSSLVSGVILSLTGFVLVAPLTITFGLVGASLSYVFATCSAAILGLYFWHNSNLHKARSTNSSNVFNRKAFFKSSFSLWFMVFMNQAVLPWAPLIMLSYWSTTENSGIFGAATRVANLVAFFLVAINAALVPKFAELFAKNDIDGISKLVTKITKYTIIIASPLLLLLIFASDWVMTLFGHQFALGGKALSILAIGQALNILAGPYGYILIMGGAERDVRNSSVVAAALMFVVALIAIPMLGIQGAAIASATAISAMSLYSVIMVRVRFGI
jgi:O-antigen/teichoic acid export membrane protein